MHIRFCLGLPLWKKTKQIKNLKHPMLSFCFAIMLHSMKHTEPCHYKRRNTNSFASMYLLDLIFFFLAEELHDTLLIFCNVTLGDLWPSWLGPSSPSEQLCQPHPLRWPPTHPHLYWSQRRWGYGSSFLLPPSLLLQCLSVRANDEIRD